MRGEVRCILALQFYCGQPDARPSVRNAASLILDTTHANYEYKHHTDLQP